MKKMKDVIDNKYIQRFFERLNVDTVEQCYFYDEDWEMLEYMLKPEIIAEIRFKILGATDNIPIGELGLSVRTQTLLLRKNIKTSKDLMENILKVNAGKIDSYEAFIRIKGIGEKARKEIYEQCELHGIILPTFKVKKHKN